MVAVTMKALLEAGVHFGHQTRRWNPKMKPYIFGDRNGIHIIDLQKTLQLFKEATDFVAGQSREGKRILFVGTKRQAQDAVKEEAERCGMHYINNRWLGGLLTNWQTVSRSLEKYKGLEAQKENNYADQISKKAIARLERQRRKLEKNLSGIRNLDSMPEVLIIVDPSKEQIAVLESNKLKVPVVALVDTNCNPEPIDYVIPGNDDALRSVRLIVSKLADAVIDGHSMRKQAEEQALKEAVDAEGEEKPAAAEAAQEVVPAGPVVREIATERKRERERTTRDTRPGGDRRDFRPRPPRRPAAPREGAAEAPAPAPAPAPAEPKAE